MSTQTYKKCPHCGKTYEFYSTYTKPKHYGSPFIICRSCGGQFVDKEMTELALEPYDTEKFSLFRCLFSTFFPVGVLGILLTWGALGSSEPSVAYYVFAILVDALYLALTIYMVVNRKKFIEEHKKEYEASVKRLSNPKYAQALKDAGFKVPEKYLKQ